MYDMTGRVAIVTGASKGIGLVAGEMLSKMGATTVFVSRSVSEEKIEMLRAENYSALSYTCDVSSEEQVKNMIDNLVGKFSRIDILINNAGIADKKKPIEEISLLDWNRIITNNLTSQFLMCKYCVPIMKRRRYGKIVNVSSIAGRFRSFTAGLDYVTSKASIIGFTRQLAYELALFNINVNAVCPSQTYTPMLTRNITVEVEESLKQQIPLGYIASPEQPANVIVFLTSDEASYMTGAIVDVNGGQF